MVSQEEPVLVAALEGGGTSFRVAVAQLGDDLPKVLYRTSVDSSHDDPARTLEECASFLKQHRPSNGYGALGLATFGPVGLNSSSPLYGCILPTTPKKAWRNIDLLTPLVSACQGSRPMAVRVETDVNAPALAEFEAIHRSQPKSELTSLAYITVGTGVGVGLVINSKCVHGNMHPEGGHVVVQPLKGDTFKGYSWGTGHSPYGGRHTVEGVASSVALTERLEQMQSSNNKQISRSVLSELPDNHEVWDHAANAIANLCVTLILTASVERIVLGGGVLKRNGLLGKIRDQTVHLLNGYLDMPKDLTDYITLSKWGDDAGFMGAVVLAQRAYQDQRSQDNDRQTPPQFNPIYVSGLVHGMVAGCLLAIAAITHRAARA